MNVIFDLDGTVSNSSEGVLATMKKTFEKYNLPRLSDDILKTYIGPPTEETLGRYLPQEKITEAVNYYRKLYKDEGGILRNKMYPGIDKLMAVLKNGGHKIYLATTKEINAAKSIIINFGIYDYFDGIYGAEPERGLYTKTDVLNELFKVTNAMKKDSILIGDTIYDANGAFDVGIKVGIVLYGFGKKDTFKGMKIDFFVESTEELKNRLIG